MPTDNRATAERIAREVYEERNVPPHATEPRSLDVALVLAGMAHRDRTAEREAARKAWDARHMWGAGSFGSQHANSARARDRYLAAEFDAGERVPLSDGSVVWRLPDGAFARGKSVEAGWDDLAEKWPAILDRPSDTGADFDAVKRLAEQRGAER